MIETLEELKTLNPRFFDYSPEITLMAEDIRPWFELCDAIWFHDGDPKKPHAELTSGKCSNGYVNCRKVFQYPNLTEILGRQLAWKIKLSLTGTEYEKLFPDGWVVSSAYAAITFGHEVAKALGLQYGHVEKDPEDPKGKRMVWSKLTIPAGTPVLNVEELITTMETTMKVRQAVIEGNGEPVEFLPVVATLVHRPAILPIGYGGLRVTAFLERAIWAVNPPCELCQQGSPRFRPSTHWAELTGKK